MILAVRSVRQRGGLAAALVLSFFPAVRGQGGPLYINEILAENDTQDPTDISGTHPDMIEIFNSGNELINLGTNALPTSYYLSATPEFNLQTAWRFPAGTTILPGGFLTVFADGDAEDALCELHASFGVANDGTEPVSLWGPEGAGGVRPLLDQIWLPPMRSDVSFGRVPDGAGPAPVPVGETFDWIQYFPRDESTFGQCIETGANCPGGRKRRTCTGAPNGTGGNLEPRVDRAGFSTVSPEANEPVSFRVRVEDDDVPTPLSEDGSIARVQIRYSVDGVDQEPVAMEYDGGLGLQDGSGDTPPRPLERWTEWTGTIPGQPGGSIVRFEFYVEDIDATSSTDPRTQCPEGTGPCDDVGLPGPGCVKEVDEFGTELPVYVSCDVRPQYLVGHETTEPFSGILINEIVAIQDNIIEDTTRLTPCPQDDPRCRYEDYIEIVNTSGEEVVLTGMWLSDRNFQPQGWPFPSGSSIPAGGRIIVWCDSDGGRCPNPPKVIGDAQECPDPTDPSLGEYHTNFGLDQAGEQVYLHQEVGEGYGLIDGVEFERQQLNVSLSRCPDASPDGDLLMVLGGTPREPNVCGIGAVFLRGDSNSDCDVNLSDGIYLLNFLFLGGPPPPCPDAADANDLGDLSLTTSIFLLNFLFLGGPAPPPPGASASGPDPTDDNLGPCTVECTGV